MADQSSKASKSMFGEIGSTGLKVHSGYVDEEFLTKLQGTRGIRIFNEMAENDSIIGAVLTAIDLLVRAADWNVVPANESDEAVDAKEFAASLFKDMNQPIEDVVSEIMSMLVYGWSYFEVVAKRRIGPYETKPERRSKYTDGRIGIRKIAIRSQDSLSRWEMQDDGGIGGMWQLPDVGTGETLIPIERSLLFRTKVSKGNPQGRSILRSAYRSWYMLKTIQNAEAIGIERDLAGLPIAYIPADVMRSDASAADKAFYAAVKQAVRDVKFNEQGGLVLPSNVYLDEDGKPSAQPLVRFELLSSGGTRSIDTNATVVRYQRDIARSVMADFIMLGTDGKGSYALSQDKTDLFLRAGETYLWRIASVFNRFLLPRMWALNGLPHELMPTVEPGKIAPTNLEELGRYIDSLSRAGMPLFPDEALESHLRGEAGLPDASAEEM